ncbi:MAG: radical SAM family heme chaperone HemW [Actinomycetes bacterium]
MTTTPSTEREAYGVYVHVPFCSVRCDYCDFATWADRSHLIADYVDAVVTDLERQRAAGAPTATTVFLGGGTPSLLDGPQMARILAAIDRAPGAEITIECNPDAVDAGRLDAYRAAGADRLSFGVQSMAPHVLRALGRTHDPDNVDRAVALARAAGFARINLDLITGTPGESLDDWRRTLDAALALDPEHLSVYALTVEPGTPLGRRVARGGAPDVDEDDQADAYLLADAALAAAGYEWYEISNWSRPGEECRHNLGYWLGGEWGAAGCAAHGYRAGRRWWNVRTPERYIERIRDGVDPASGDEVLAPGGVAEEAFGLALRTRSGAAVDPAADEEVATLVVGDLVRRTGDRVVLTPTGRLVASDITARLVLAGGVPVV